MRKIPAGPLKVIRTLKKSGHQAYLVGGCIRDLMIGLPVTEWDITTSARPDKVSALFKKVAPTGIKYGTVTVILSSGKFEVTTFRADEKYVDGRHPENVVFTDDIHKDLSRRDFTINAMACDPFTRELIDDFSGRKDLQKKIIRAVGDPVERFSEDGLRSVRACRFAARLGFKIEKKTFSAMAKTLRVTRKVAGERIRDEIVKLMASKKPSAGFELMRRSGLLKLILPELEKCYRVRQPRRFHRYDVYWHSLYACDAAPAGNTILRMAALLHDIGKPKCKAGSTFYGHDQEGAKTAEKILTRLKFSRDDIRKITGLISHHMFNYTAGWSDATVRRFIRRVGGSENLNDLFTLREADTRAMEQEIGSAYLGRLKKRIKKILAEENALHVSDLKVSGKDVMRVLGIPPGPRVGKTLADLLEKVLDNPGLNRRQTLLNILKENA